jgi:hypothetical protein
MFTFIDTFSGRLTKLSLTKDERKEVISLIKAGVPFYLWLTLDSTYLDSFHGFYILLAACKLKDACSFYNTEEPENPIVYRMIDGTIYRVDNKTYETIIG